MRTNILLLLMLNACLAKNAPNDSTNDSPVAPAEIDSSSFLDSLVLIQVTDGQKPLALAGEVEVTHPDGLVRGYPSWRSVSEAYRKADIPDGSRVEVREVPTGLSFPSRADRRVVPYAADVQVSYVNKTTGLGVSESAESLINKLRVGQGTDGDLLTPRSEAHRPQLSVKVATYAEAEALAARVETEYGVTYRTSLEPDRDRSGAYRVLITHSTMPKVRIHPVAAAGDAAVIESHRDTLSTTLADLLVPPSAGAAAGGRPFHHGARVTYGDGVPEQSFGSRGQSLVTARVPTRHRDVGPYGRQADVQVVNHNPYLQRAGTRDQGAIDAKVTARRVDIENQLSAAFAGGARSQAVDLAGEAPVAAPTIVRGGRLGSGTDGEVHAIDATTLVVKSIQIPAGHDRDLFLRDVAEEAAYASVFGEIGAGLPLHRVQKSSTGAIQLVTDRALGDVDSGPALNSMQLKDLAAQYQAVNELGYFLGDAKTANTLRARDGRAVLSDFGARFIKKLDVDGKIQPSYAPGTYFTPGYGKVEDGRKAQSFLFALAALANHYQGGADNVVVRGAIQRTVAGPQGFDTEFIYADKMQDGKAEQYGNHGLQPSELWRLPNKSLRHFVIERRSAFASLSDAEFYTLADMLHPDEDKRPSLGQFIALPGGAAAAAAPQAAAGAAGPVR